VYVNDRGHGGGPLVVCSTTAQDPRGFPQAPPSGPPGFRSNLAVVKASGEFWWDIGNIAGSSAPLARDIVLKYGQTYHMNGWTIQPTVDGTRFTNDGTGHGMFVSVENVYAF
jgi:hypothetical protein